MLDRILVVDDEPLVLEVLADVLTREGFQVSQAAEARTALEQLAREPHVLVLCDIRMPGMDGFELLKEIRRCHPGTDVVMMTGFGSLDGAVDAMSLGAADYLIKPLKPKEIVARLRSILQRRKLEAELLSLQSELRSRYEMHNLVANSPRMMAVVSALNRISGSEESVVLYGEEGTGRRFLSRSIHFGSQRRNEAFSSMACDVAPPEGHSAALFGERKPNRRIRRGHLDRMRGGTLHLFHFECLPEEVQDEVASCLATRAWSRRGDGEAMTLDTRLIFSTTAPISDLLAEGSLTSALGNLLKDLVTIHLPPLRHRMEDVPDLVAAFIEDYALENGQSLRLPRESVELIARHPLPGNVKQLFAILNHAATLSLDGVVRPETLERSLRQANLVRDDSHPKPIADHLGDREYQLVLRAVQRNPGRLDEAAKELGVSRTTLWRRMRKYGIRVSTPS